MKRFRHFIISSFMALAVGLSLTPALATPVLALTPQQNACIGVNNNTSGSCANPPGSVDINSVIKTVINIISIVVGVAAVIMIVIAGLKYTTSGGDASSVSSAKNTIIYALVGLVIVSLAQFFARYVLHML